MRIISIIGLGYVGLPVAIAFGKVAEVIGFDINKKRINELKQGFDNTNEVESSELKTSRVYFTDNIETLKKADFYIVCVPTPVDKMNVPDLNPLINATKIVANKKKKGDIVVYESTVYPGCTEEVCAPILEEISNLKFNQDFEIGFSPERINPGDKNNRFETIKKVVSASSDEALDIVTTQYESVVKAGVYKAGSIKVAEAAKVIENAQRDINIAFMNELAIIFKKIGIDTKEVLDAASTKWNFLNFQPGLVGGHCIGVDPYYLTYKAEQLGYKSEIILSGRKINDNMGGWIAQNIIKQAINNKIENFVTVFGLTFKENVPDIRNSKSYDIIGEFKEWGYKVQTHDPFLPQTTLEKSNIIVLAVAHDEYKAKGWSLIEESVDIEKTVIVADIKGILDKEQKPDNVILWRL